MAYNRASEKDNAPEMIERVVYLNRVSKTVKGGRVMKFSALVVVGDSSLISPSVTRSLSNVDSQPTDLRTRVGQTGRRSIPCANW